MRTGATFANAAAEWLRYVTNDRDVKPSTLRVYHSVAERLVKEFGELPVEEVTSKRIEAWRARLAADRARPLTNRTRNKSLTILGGIMDRARKVYSLPSHPARDVEKLRERYDATRFDFYSPEEVWAVVRAAASEQDVGRSRCGSLGPPANGGCSKACSSSYIATGMAQVRCGSAKRQPID